MKANCSSLRENIFLGLHSGGFTSFQLWKSKAFGSALFGRHITFFNRSKLLDSYLPWSAEIKYTIHSKSGFNGRVKEVVSIHILKVLDFGSFRIIFKKIEPPITNATSIQLHVIA